MWEDISPRYASRADIMKAFDSVSWDFLLNILRAIEVPAEFINWVETCITGPVFSVNINGGIEGYFQGSKGLRQGDPLSPYLFVMTIEVLSRLLDSAAAEGRIAYHPTCRKAHPTHLGFADDLIIFTQGDGKNVQFWFDNWNVGCPLIGWTGGQKFGMPLYATAAEVETRSLGIQWQYRTVNRQAIHEIISAVNLVPGKEDVVVWLADNKRQFTVASAWNALRKEARVRWHALVWKTPIIPRHSFISWLALDNKLATLDRVVAWNVAAGSIFPLCNEDNESRDHLFFACKFSKMVWEKVLQESGVHRSVGSWYEEPKLGNKAFKRQIL
ncbi:hypothetical protein CRG98_040644 [Punica granatum]|uniref:Reverse transcriptase domain-containing protein n=1 Tax=Punica granatum TaxID=22663 RepID=A0A2I0I4S1_PUNGR|nr:hypothetical protein CRG98_040644 [Punica granatum]